MADEQGPVFEFAFEGDDESARRESARMTRIIADGLGDAFKKLGPTIGRDIAKALSQGDRAFKSLGDEAVKSATRSKNAIDDLIADTDALNRRVAATRSQLERVGAQPELFAVIDRELAKVQSSFRSFNSDIERIADNPNLLDGYEVSFRNAQQTIFREVAGIQSVLRNLSAVQRTEGNRANEVASRQAQERIAILRGANSREIVATQGANAQLLAETRANAQQRLQSERASARTRIELVRFTFQQIRVLERGIAAAFRGTANVLESTVRSLTRGIGRIGNLFRRANTDLNDGLNGALLQRERSISRSFRRQETFVHSSIARQSATIQRFEAQASTGIAGAVTGRSSLGGLLGGGLAIGGGVGIFAGIRNQLKVGGDFVQGLAVLQAQLKLTDEQMAGVRQQAIDLGNDISLPGVSALDAAQSIQILAKQFASLGDEALPAAQAAAKGVLQLSRASGVAADEAARVVGAAVNVFGAAASDAVAIADQVTNALTNAAGLGFGDFADSFTQAASVVNLFIGPAQEATSSIAEFNAAIAVLAKGGLIGSDAGTSLKQFFLQANRAAAPAQAAMQKLSENAGITGTAFFDASGNARTLTDTLDILRRGVSGLTQQARVNILQTLFGSDAARAAGILIDLGGNFDDLVGKIQETGSAAAIAAAQNVGLRGALDALGSVIETQQIKTYERYQKVLGAVVIQFAILLDQFFNGVGVLGVIRDALLGAGAALGSLLVAKAAAEALTFLRISLAALLSPLGAIVAAVTVLGAAINVLRLRSPELARALSELGDVLGAGLGFAASLGAELLGRLADTITTRVAPALERLTVFIANNLNAGLRTAFDFIDDTAIPAVLRFAGFLDQTVIPALVTLATTLTDRVVDGLRAARDGLVDLFSVIEPYIAPAIRGFEQLGTAIATAFSDGDFSGILPGLAAVGEGIARSFANIGSELIAVLGPQLERVVGFISSFFSGGGGRGGAAGSAVQNFLLGPFQDAVEALGFFLGNLATDPRLILALEKVIGLALVTGANFVQGLARGIADNLPELGAMFASQLASAITAGLRAALDPRKIALAIVAGLGAFAIGQAIFQAMQRPVNAAGQRVGRGFVGSLASSIAGGVRAGGGNVFASAMFGGFDQHIARLGQRTLASLQREQSRAAESLRLLGQGSRGIAASFVGADGAQAVVRNSVKTLDGLISKYGEAAVAGGVLRGRLNEVFTSIGDGARRTSIGFQQSFTEGFRSLGESGRVLGRNITGLLGDVGRNIRAAGIGVGQALGGAIVSGVGAALSGQQLGRATSAGGKALGLAGIVSSSLFAFTATGGGAQGAAAAGLVASIGLITAAISSSGAAAKRAADEVREYADALAEVNTAAEAGEAATKIVLENLKDEDQAVRDVLLGVRFNARAFADEVIAGSFDASDAIRTIGPAFGDASTEAITELQRLRREGESPIRALQLAAGGQLPSDNMFFDLQRILDDLSPSEIRAIASALDALLDEGSELREGLFDDAQFRALATAAAPALTSLTAGVAGVSGATQQATKDLGQFSGGIEYVEGLIARGQAAIIERGRIAGENAGIIRLAVERLNEVRTGAIQGQIDEVTRKLDAAKTAAQLARDQLTAYLTGDYTNTAQQALDQVVLDIPSVGTAIAEALAAGGVAGEAALRQATEGFDQRLASIISAGFEDGLSSVGDFQALVQPITLAIGEADLPQSVKDELIAQVNAAVTDSALQVGLDTVADADAEVAKQQSEFDRLNLELKANVVFDPEQIKAAAKALGLTIDIGAIPTVLLNQNPAVRDFTTPDSQVASQAITQANGVAALVSEVTDALRGGPSRNDQQDVPRVQIQTNIERQEVTQNIIGSGNPTVTASESTRKLRAAAGGAFNLGALF